MQHDQGEVKVNMVSLEGFSHCSLEGCRGGHTKEVQRNVQYLKVEARFPQIDERIDHEADRPDMAMIKVFETNFRSEPEISSTITGQLIEGDVVNVIDRQGEWVKVQGGSRIGWVNQGSLYFYKEIQQHRQLKGETHASYICEKCAERLDWRQFYRKEIEAKQVGHVLSNYTFDYTEMAMAMEEEIQLVDGEVEKQAIEDRIQEEIESGHHGLAKRFNYNKVLNYILRHRPAC